MISATTSTTVRVKNTGDRSAGPFSIAVENGYLDYQCDFDRPIPSVRRDVSGLGPGQSRTVTIPGSSTARHVTVDYLNAVTESNEFNNTETVPSWGIDSLLTPDAKQHEGPALRRAFAASAGRHARACSDDGAA